MSPLAIRAGVPGAVRADVREVDGRQVVWVDVDASERQGALSSSSSSQIEAAAVLALHERLPLVAVIRSSGADIQEGFAALHGWGLAARAIANCSGVVPVIMIVDGPAVSGPALLIGLADLVVMTDQSYAFVSGPTMVAEFTGVMMDADELGGAASHARYTGAATLVATDLEVAIEMVAHLLSFLPSHNDEDAPRWPTDDPIDRDSSDAGRLIPASWTGSYDVGDVNRAIAP
ncbi:MAG: pccB, partial [Ilumatobacteraceae bacterium]|nr:pccB [Ilumatobacteraceae bacterium]